MNTIMKIKWPPTVLQGIFESHVSNKGLDSRVLVYKEPLQLNEKSLNMNFSKKTEHTSRCLTPLVIREL